MQVGVFIPIGNNGWLMSEAAPQYKPSFELNKHVVQKAEEYGLDFALSMIKLRGYGGKTEFWDHNLESFTLMAGLAAVTDKIKIFATAATLLMPPAIVARMAATINSIAPGRFGINLITGWAYGEYAQMGMWPGEVHYKQRYAVLAEYATVLRELLDTGVSDFKGEHYQMEDCRVSPTAPGTKLICAGSSPEGLAFTATHADYAFVLGKGVNTPTAFAPTAAGLRAAADKTGRDVAAFTLFTIIAAETDEAAQARWRAYVEGADAVALARFGEQGKANLVVQGTNVDQLTSGAELPEEVAARKAEIERQIKEGSPINLNIGTLVGSYASVAAMLDEVAGVPDNAGVLLIFDDFRQGIVDFGEKIQPLMKSRG